MLDGATLMPSEEQRRPARFSVKAPKVSSCLSASALCDLLLPKADLSENRQAREKKKPRKAVLPHLVRWHIGYAVYRWLAGEPPHC